MYKKCSVQRVVEEFKFQDIQPIFNFVQFSLINIFAIVFNFRYNFFDFLQFLGNGFQAAEGRLCLNTVPDIGNSAGE